MGGVLKKEGRELEVCWVWDMGKVGEKRKIDG